MNWADYAIVAILALSVLIGLWRGLLTEVMALAIWIAAFWVAWMFGPRVADWFVDLIQTPSIRIIVGYALCFLAVLLVGALLRFALSRLIEGTGLSGTDRLLGMIFGLIRGVLLVALLVFVLSFTPLSRDAWWHQSRLLPSFITTAQWLGNHLPKDIQRYLHPQGAGDGSGHDWENMLKLPHDFPGSSGSVAPARSSSSRLPASASSSNHPGTP